MSKNTNSYEYAFVTRFKPYPTQNVERWTLEQLRNFISRPEVRKTHSLKEGYFYENEDIRIFITPVVNDLVLDEKGRE